MAATGAIFYLYDEGIAFSSTPFNRPPSYVPACNVTNDQTSLGYYPNQLIEPNPSAMST